MTSLTPKEIVKEYFPGISDEEALSILWNHTGFPGFWAGDPETCLRDQLAQLKEHCPDEDGM